MLLEKRLVKVMWYPMNFLLCNESSFSIITQLHFDSQVLGLNTHFALDAHFIWWHLLSHGGSIAKGFKELIKMFTFSSNNVRVI